MKVVDAIGAQLDWMVAKCEGVVLEYGLTDDERYSTNWAQEIGRAHVAQFVERVKISVVWSHWQWCAGIGDIGEIYRSDEGNHFTGTGPTPLIAAMRCYCCSKLGDIVDVPEELCQSQNS